MTERARKTYHVEDLRKLVNERMQISDEALHRAIIVDQTPAQAYRTALSGLLESVLMETGNYRGFVFLDHTKAREPGDPTDETRRRYF